MACQLSGHVLRRNLRPHAASLCREGERAFPSFLLLLLLALGSLCRVTQGVPPLPVFCANGDTGPGKCTVNNAYGMNIDGVNCTASAVIYPTSEAELISAVAYASRYNLKVKVVSQFIHTTPKWFCAGGNNGIIIATNQYNNIDLDLQSMTATIDSGVMLYDFFNYLAQYGVTFPSSPYWDGVSVVGAFSTGSHGSTLQMKGGRMSNYVKNITVVVPDTAARGYASVRVLDRGDYLAAGKLSLGLLGAISRVTLEVFPMWKRQAYLYNTSDANLENEVLEFASNTTFPDLNWYPASRSVLWRKDDMVPASTPGTGSYGLLLFPGRPEYAWEAIQNADTSGDAQRNSTAQCEAWLNVQAPALIYGGGGFTNDGSNFRGFPVVGYHNRFQSSSGCEFSQDTPAFKVCCAWDPRINGVRFFETTFLLPLTKLKDYILTIKKLRDARPYGLCGIHLYGGFFFRFMKAGTDLLGPDEDSVMIDTQYHRNVDVTEPRTGGDITDEVEQIGQKLFDGKPHWGKNRDVAFDDVLHKYPRARRFLQIRRQLDPRGLFLNEWAERVFQISGQPVQTYKPYCGLQGTCHCKEDSHCSPGKGSTCQAGLVYEEANVCRLANGQG